MVNFVADQKRCSPVAINRRGKGSNGLQRDSNPWPPRYRCEALPTELWSHTWERGQFIEFIFPVRSEMMWSIHEIIPLKPWFFSGFFFPIAYIGKFTAMITLHFDLQPQFKYMNYFIYTSHHFTPHGRYELNKLTSLTMCGFIAQLVEHRTGIAEVTGSNPVEALILSGFFFPIVYIGKFTAMITLHFDLQPQFKYMNYFLDFNLCLLIADI